MQSFAQTVEVSPKEEERGLQFVADYRHAAFRGPVSSSGNGVLAELRLNIGKLLKRTPSFSLLAGWGFQDRLRSAGFRPKSVKDYAQGIQADDLQRDLIAESLHLLSTTPLQQAPLQGGCETNSFHDYQLYGGISLQPSAHLPLQIKVTAGTLRSYRLKDYSATRELFSFELRRAGTLLAAGLTSASFKKRHLSFLLRLVTKC